jgi:hypothetical protein
MWTRKTIIGLCALCALLVSAFAAQGAVAGQTITKCGKTVANQDPETNRFKDAHCKESTGKPAEGEWVHEKTAAKEKMEAALTNITTGTAREPLFYESVVGGLNTIFEAKKVEGTGTVENNEAGGEMYAEGLAETITFSEVVVVNRECEIFGITPGTGVKTKGIVKTQPIRGTTKGQAAGVIKFEPQAAGGKFAEFELTGASCPEALKGLFPLFGTFLSQKTEGATTPVTHKPITEAKTLRLKNATTGPVAGVSGKLTTSSGGFGLALTTTTP